MVEAKLDHHLHRRLMTLESKAFSRLFETNHWMYCLVFRWTQRGKWEGGERDAEHVNKAARHAGTWAGITFLFSPIWRCYSVNTPLDPPELSLPSHLIVLHPTSYLACCLVWKPISTTKQNPILSHNYDLLIITYDIVSHNYEILSHYDLTIS